MMEFKVAGTIDGGTRKDAATMLSHMVTQIEKSEESDIITIEGAGVQVTAVFENPCVELLEMHPQPVINGSLVFWNGFIWMRKSEDELRLDDGPSWGPLQRMVARCLIPDVNGEVEQIGIRCLNDRWYWRVEWTEKSN